MAVEEGGPEADRAPIPGKGIAGMPADKGLAFLEASPFVP
jgi:hypothetical protein